MSTERGSRSGQGTLKIIASYQHLQVTDQYTQLENVVFVCGVCEWCVSEWCDV